MVKALNVKGNKILDTSGEEVFIKGINTNSPCILKFQEDHDVLQDIREIKKLGANAVRIPICPAYFQSREDYCEELLDPIVALSKDLGLYCVLDWHAQGNPYTNKTREFGNVTIEGFEKYDARKEIAFIALDKISRRYGSESHVLFDIFGMPIDIENKDWIEISQKFVNIVRENTDNIIFVNATNWASDLSWVLENPINAKNIVYGYAYYPMGMFRDLSQVFKVKEKYPVVFPECGYTPDGYFKGTQEDYAVKLKKYILNYKIGFFAWAYHPKRVPVLLNSWNPNDLSEWGRFVKEELLK